MSLLDIFRKGPTTKHLLRKQAEIRELREENKRLREQIGALTGHLKKIQEITRESNDGYWFL